MVTTTIRNIRKREEINFRLYLFFSMMWLRLEQLGVAEENVAAVSSWPDCASSTWIALHWAKEISTPQNHFTIHRLQIFKGDPTGNIDIYIFYAILLYKKRHCQSVISSSYPKPTSKLASEKKSVLNLMIS